MNTTIINNTNRGNGYDHDRNLSINAIAAQNAGLIPGSVKLAKELAKIGYKGLPLEWLTRNAPACEYHHHGSAIAGGKYIQSVLYYELAEVIDWLSTQDVAAVKAAAKLAKKERGQVVFVGLVEWKEYRTDGAHGAKTGHTVRYVASITNSGKYYTVTPLLNKGEQTCFWRNNKYGRGDGGAYSACNWHKYGEAFRKEQVTFVEAINDREILDLIACEQAEERAEADERRRYAAAEKERIAAAQQAAMEQAVNFRASLPNKLADAYTTTNKQASGLSWSSYRALMKSTYPDEWQEMKVYEAGTNFIS